MISSFSDTGILTYVVLRYQT